MGNNGFLRDFVLPAGDLVFGQRMMDRLKYLEKAQYWSREEISDRQNNDLQNLLQVAYNDVPLYKDLFDDAGINPKDIRTPSDLVVLPMVTKDMLRAGYPDRTARPTGQKTYETRTSGSTGKNFAVMEDAFTAGWYRAAFMLALEWTGWKIGEPHLQTGMTLDRSLDRRLKDWLLNCHYVSAYQLDDSHLDEILNEIESERIHYAWGYPGSLYFLAKRASLTGRDITLKAVVTWGDTLLPQYRKLIEETFHTRVFDTYGCAEGIQVAAQCEFGNYHIHALDTVVEFLDDHGQPVQPGETGSIILTRLHPGPMPLIRYAVGDLGVPSDKTSCPCGRGLPLMAAIKGRSADVVITPSGNRLIVHFFTGILENFPEIDSFQVVQDKKDAINIRIVPNDTLDVQKLEQIKELLISRGADLLINFELVEEIPLPPSGKHRFVISHLDSSI